MTAGVSSDMPNSTVGLTDAVPLREVGVVVLTGMAVFVLLAVLSYSPFDSAWNYQSSHPEIRNMVGRSGAYAADIADLALASRRPACWRGWGHRQCAGRRWYAAVSLGWADSVAGDSAYGCCPGYLWLFLVGCRRAGGSKRGCALRGNLHVVRSSQRSLYRLARGARSTCRCYRRASQSARTRAHSE